MEDKQLYVSFEKDYYKSNKSNILVCQAELINLQKKLQRLKAIRATKKRLVNQLTSLISSSNIIVQRASGKLPEISLHKKIKDKIKKRKKTFYSGEKIDDFDIDNLDKELMEINRKIKELNG